MENKYEVSLTPENQSVEKIKEIGEQLGSLAKKYIEKYKVDIQGSTDIDTQVKTFTAGVLEAVQSKEFSSLPEQEKEALLSTVKQDLKYLEGNLDDPSGVRLSTLDFIKGINEVFEEFKKYLK